MFRSYERSVPYNTMARIIESKNAATRDEKELCEHTLRATWAYEQLTYKYQRTQKKVDNLESELKEKELKLNKFAVLQKTLDDLRVEHDKTVSRLAKAEAKIRELENAKVETEDRDLKEVPTKPVPQKGWIHCDLVIAPDGFSYVKGPGSK
jgi:septal ring factor EnvC (AmiA/AmiB activator)